MLLLSERRFKNQVVLSFRKTFEFSCRWKNIHPKVLPSGVAPQSAKGKPNVKVTSRVINERHQQAIDRRTRYRGRSSVLEAEEGRKDGFTSCWQQDTDLDSVTATHSDTF